MKKAFFILSLLFIGSHPLSAGTVSFDQLSVSADLTATKYNSDLNTIYNEFNGNIQTANVADDTLTEADMADEINPRIRTNESASCPDIVITGLLPTTTTSTLTGSIPAGTAYPDGFRVNKASATPKTFTASMWTFVDIDINGDFTYSEVAIDGSTPAVATNSARLARVSTDATEVNNVQDLRTTNCASGPFEAISDASGEATLDDLLANGSPVRGRGSVGWIQGLQVSWDAHTTFKVLKGSVYINGEFRSISTDITVPQTNDNPSQGTSGLDTASINSNTKYNVYAVADQDSVKTFSISYSTDVNAPGGVTNYRYIGTIKTDSNSAFTSADITNANSITPKETVSGWAVYDQTGTAQLLNSFNVSAFGDTAQGQGTITWDRDFENANYACAITVDFSEIGFHGVDVQTASSIQIITKDNSNAAQDKDRVYIVCSGE